MYFTDSPDVDTICFIPIGAPKAADTPAAAPPETKSRFSWSSRKYCNILKSLLKVVLLPCDIPAATTAPLCIMGPSCKMHLEERYNLLLYITDVFSKQHTFPPANPPTTADITPTVFTKSVLILTTLGTFTPFK